MTTKEINDLLDMVEYCKERLYNVTTNPYEKSYKLSSFDLDELDLTLDSIQSKLLDALKLTLNNP